MRTVTIEPSGTIDQAGTSWLNTRCAGRAGVTTSTGLISRPASAASAMAGDFLWPKKVGTGTGDGRGGGLATPNAMLVPGETHVPGGTCCANTRSAGTDDVTTRIGSAQRPSEASTSSACHWLIPRSAGTATTVAPPPGGAGGT